MMDDDLDYLILSDEDFGSALARLNAICGLSSRWQKTSASKSHIDKFGVKIKLGEDYYKREYGGSYSSVLKLSRRSMDKLLFATVHTCPTAEQFADLLLEEEKATFLALRDRISK